MLNLTMTTKSSIINLLNLPRPETDILLYLSQHNATAKDILKNTTISNGRIYNLLSNLESLGLISKTSGKQAIYSMQSFSQNIQKFLESSFKNFSQNQSLITQSLVSLEDTIQTDIIYGTKEDFDAQIAKMLDEAKWLKIIHKHVSLPWFLYCHDEKNFFKVRNTITKTRTTGSSANKYNLLLKRAAYLRAYSTKPVEHIMLLDTFKKYSKHLDLPALKKNLKKFPKTKIYLLNKLHNPFSTYISDKQVLQVLFFENKQDRILKLSGKPIISTFIDYFNKYKEDSIILQPLPKQI